MTMNSVKILTSTLGFIAFGAATYLRVLSCPSSAHDEGATIGDLVVDEVAATPAKAGETTRITLSVENSGPDRVTITGVRWPTGEPSRVMSFLGSSHSAALGGLPINAGEALRLDCKSAWIKVGPLKANVASGVVVLARLVLGHFEALLPVHVSPASQRDAATPGPRNRQVTTDALFGFIASGGPAWLRSAKC